MTTDRCPACGASVTPGAPWCTLCYCDLRPPAPVEAAPAAAPAPAFAPAPVPALVPAAAAPAFASSAVALADPLTDPLPGLLPPLLGQAPSWPCFGCGARMPMSEDACTQCGRPFLPAEEAPTLSLPGVGNLGQLDRTQRMFLAMGGLVVMTLVLLALAFLAGSIL